MFRSLTLILMQFALVIDNQTPAKLNQSTEYFSTLVRWAKYFLPTTASPHPAHYIRRTLSIKYCSALAILLLLLHRTLHILIFSFRIKNPRYREHP